MYHKKNLQVIYDFLLLCKGVPQNKKTHPEGDVFNHSFQCLHVAIQETNDPEMILAALCHDIGKFITKRNHERESAKLINGLLPTRIVWLVSKHGKINSFFNGRLKNKKEVIEISNSPWFKDLVILSRWDKMARRKNFKPYYNLEKLLEILETKSNIITKINTKKKKGKKSNGRKK